MAKTRKVVITGQQRTDLDAGAFAQVIIRLARQWWQNRQQSTEPASPHTDNQKEAS